MFAENAPAQSQANVNPAAGPPTLTAAQRERLKERNRQEQQASKLRSEGKLAEAITATEAMLAIEREVLGEASDDAISSIEQIAEIHEQRQDWPTAISTRRNVLNLRVRAHGEKNWKITDARMALEDTERHAAMPREQLQKLAEATRASFEFDALSWAGKYRQAMEPARRVEALHKEVLGQRHPVYATSVHNLGAVFDYQGDYAAARPLYERALAIRKEVLGELHPITSPA